MTDGPFDLQAHDAYRRWRDAKLDGYPGTVGDLLVTVADPAAPNDAERAAIRARIGKCNMALYRFANPPADPKAAVRAFGAAFGLARLDAHLQSDASCITALEVAADDARTRYIPYTDRPIQWHTDGYYNLPEDRVRGLILHCARPAVEGGENALLDPEIAYIVLRDADPAFIAALAHPRAFVVPPNESDGDTIRGERANPVFYVDPASGVPCMNFSQRKRNMAWRDDAATRDALQCLNEFLASDSPYIFRHRMAPGEGVICNNVLHNRSGFTDGETKRLMFRGRYMDRVAA